MKKAWKKQLLAAAVSGLCIVTLPATASGIPTVDVAAIAQMAQQLKQLKDQYDLLRQQYESVTGSYGRGQGMDSVLDSSSVVPGSWQDVVRQQKSGVFANKQAYYEKLIDTLPSELFRNPDGREAGTYQLSTDAVRAAMAGGDALYAQVQQHINNLTRLARQVDNTTNIKDAQDLQNRIQVENALLQTAMARMNAMTSNLQANQLNLQNQSKAANQRYFRW
ncbi:type IV secretion system protein [Limnobaculum xujianqingii]|nr:type IV secretion system protein [Limnobaculum xujianqingii]